MLETLWKETRLQVSQRISNTVIVGGVPKVLDLKEMIKYYVEYRNQVILNISKAKYNKIMDRIEVVDGL